MKHQSYRWSIFFTLKIFSFQSACGTRDNNFTYFSDDEISGKKYIRLSVEDKFGVLEKIAGIFSKNKVSIASVIQKEVNTKGLADLVIMTHESSEINFKNSLVQIRKLDFVKEDPITFEIYKLWME